MVSEGSDRWLRKACAGLGALAVALGGCNDPSTGTFDARASEKAAAEKNLRPGGNAKPSPKAALRARKGQEAGAATPKP